MIDYGFGVTLSRIRPDKHTEKLFAWRNDPRIYGMSRQFEPIHWKKHLEWIERQAVDPSLSFFVVEGYARIAMGVVGLSGIDMVNRKAEFSVYVDPNLPRAGRGSAALKTLFTHGFSSMGLHTIWGETFENNPAQGVFEKLGMRHEGTRRDAYYRGGQWVASHLYAMTEDEWKSCLPSWEQRTLLRPSG